MDFKIFQKIEIHFKAKGHIGHVTILLFFTSLHLLTNVA